MALPYLPTEKPRNPKVQRFSMLEGFGAVKFLAIKQTVYYKMANIFNYFENYWIKTITPERFSIHGCDLKTNYAIESYHYFLQDHLGVRPPVWTLYGKFLTNILFLFLFLNITVLLLDRLRDLDWLSSLSMDQLTNSQPVCLYYKTL